MLLCESLPFLSAAEGQRPRNYSSCCSSCWIFCFKNSRDLSLSLFAFLLFFQYFYFFFLFIIFYHHIYNSIKYEYLPTYVYLPTFTYLQQHTYLSISTHLPTYDILPTYVNLPTPTNLHQHTYLPMSTYQHIPTHVNLPSSTYLPLPILKYQYRIATDPGASIGLVIVIGVISTSCLCIILSQHT